MQKRTWIGVLVGAIIIVLTCGLLLPPVSKVRDAANRVKCQNHLKWIGLALHNYHDIHGAFPQATIANPKLLPEKRLSFFVALLPYLEEETVARSMDMAGAWDSDGNREAAGTSIGASRCPLGKGPGEITHYVGIAGLGKDAANLKPGEPGVGFFGHARTVSLRPVVKPGETSAEVTDGTANTAMIVETAAECGPWLAGGHPTVRGIDPATTPYLGVGRPFGGYHIVEKRWFDRNVSGANVGFGDGSVRFIRDTVDSSVIEALATIAGGEKVNTHDY